MKNILTILLLFVASISYGQTAIYGGRTYTPQSFSRATWCSCSMCQNIRSQWAASTVQPVQVVPKVIVETTKVTDDDYKTKYREETKTVYETQYRTETYQRKVCTGRTCYYVTDTRQIPYQVAKQVTVKVPYRVKKEAKKQEKKEKQVSTVDTSKPKESQARKPKSDLIPTPIEAVNKVMEILKPRPTDVLVDAGCGDGRFLIKASESGCRAIGVELNPQIVEIARARIEATGSNAIVLQGDALEFDYSAADIVVIYQMPDLLADIVARVPNGVTVASYMHEIPNVNTQRHTLKIGDEIKSIYVGVVGGEIQLAKTFGL